MSPNANSTPELDIARNVVRLRAWVANLESSAALAEPLRHYVLVRADLPHGMQIAQTIHASGESVRGMDLPSNTHAVGLHARSEAELLAVEAKLKAAGIPHRAIREVDGKHEGQLMAIGVHPLAGKEARRRLSSLPLAK